MPLGPREFLILSVCVTRALIDQSVEICWCICLGQMVHVLCAIAIEHAVQVVVRVISGAGVLLEQFWRTIPALPDDRSAILEGLSAAMMVLCLPDFV